ncbi:hypothetical protein ACFCZ5_09935 [Streptomyces microflavus]|uniref:hypothetical protein n=1 Tax=Streptomyces microflavus TaxID=1919 RepID=UPI0033B7199F
MDYVALLAAALPITLLLALLCVTLICLVAILRANRRDVVQVLNSLPNIISAMLRRKP